MLAYLDNNIFVAVDNGEFSIKKIYQNVSQQISAIPFSATHIRELNSITADAANIREQLIGRRLSVIRSITNCLYIFHELPTHKVYFLKTDPAEVLETINFNALATQAIQTFTNLFQATDRERVREHFGIDPKEINNYKPSEVVRHLNKKLTGLLGVDMTFLALMEQAFSMLPFTQNAQLYHKIAAAFEFLDFLGYWKDQATEKSNLARLWDSSHTYYASFCDFFVSDDKRARMKAQVVYDLYGIDTIITSSAGS